VHLPVFNVQFPAISFLVVEQIVSVATFDIPYVEVDSIFGEESLPSDDQIFEDSTGRENLVEALDILGYNSRFLSRVMGSVYIIMLITIVALALIVVLIPCRSTCQVMLKFHDKLKGYFLWNFVIRLIFEACLELSISVIINLHFTHDIKASSTWIEAFDYVLAIFMAVCLVSMPVFILVFYCRNFERLEDSEFAQKYGSVYEGLVIKRSALFYPFFFIIRRATLALTALKNENFVWLQIALQIYLTLAQAVYLLHFKPFDNSLVQKLEVYNEICSLFLLACVLCFTDLIPSLLIR